MTHLDETANTLVIDAGAQAAIDPADGSYKVGNFSKGAVRGDVSSQWASRPDDERFTDLNALRDHLAAVHERSYETPLPVNAIEFVAGDIADPKARFDLRIGAPSLANPVRPTHWSFGQLASMAGAPGNYLRRLPAELAADALTWGLHTQRGGEADVMLYGDDDRLHAVTSAKYGRIPDHTVVDAVRKIAGSGRGEMRWKIPGELDWSTMRYHPNIDITKENTTLYASDRDFFIFLCDDRNPIEVGKLPTGEPDLMFRGFYLHGSSVGAYKQSLAAFYLRGVCMNRNLWGVEGFQEIDLIHTQSAPDRWLAEAQPALLSYAEGSTQKLIAGVRAAKARVVAKDEEEAIAFLARHCKFSDGLAKAVLAKGEEEEGRPPRSVWDLAQAITAHARGIGHADVRLTMEEKAKRLLDRVA